MVTERTLRQQATTMATDQLGLAVQRLRRSLLGREAGDLADGTLLGRFLSGRDEAAFEALVRRHGPMVLGVCRRVLGNHADAEDACQATFLVLARRASSVQPPELVGSWLHGVARNTARKLKVQNHRRRAREREAAAQAQRETPAGTRPRPEELLDEGIQALPEKYRAVIVLCDLEGRSLREAAQLLSCPVGTVGTRLARGRRLLA